MISPNDGVLSPDTHAKPTAARLSRGGPTAADQQEGTAQCDHGQDEQDPGVDVTAGVGRAG